MRTNLSTRARLNQQKLKIFICFACLKKGKQESPGRATSRSRIQPPTPGGREKLTQINVCKANKQMHDKHKDRLPDEHKIAKLPHGLSININDKTVCTENNLHWLLYPALGKTWHHLASLMMLTNYPVRQCFQI